jgi:hypothetical protein
VSTASNGRLRQAQRNSRQNTDNNKVKLVVILVSISSREIVYAGWFVGLTGVQRAPSVSIGRQSSLIEIVSIRATIAII